MEKNKNFNYCVVRKFFYERNKKPVFVIYKAGREPTPYW